MEAVILCDAFSWSYIKGAYIDQPKWFIEYLIGKREVDKELEDKATAKKPSRRR